MMVTTCPLSPYLVAAYPKNNPIQSPCNPTFNPHINLYNPQKSPLCTPNPHNIIYHCLTPNLKVIQRKMLMSWLGVGLPKGRIESVKCLYPAISPLYIYNSIWPNKNRPPWNISKNIYICPLFHIRSPFFGWLNPHESTTRSRIFRHPTRSPHPPHLGSRMTETWLRLCLYM